MMNETKRDSNQGLPIEKSSTNATRSYGAICVEYLVLAVCGLASTPIFLFAVFVYSSLNVENIDAQVFSDFGSLSFFLLLNILTVLIIFGIAVPLATSYRRAKAQGRKWIGPAALRIVVYFSAVALTTLFFFAR
ncbi:MAG: hypothetical protein LBJ48_08130 [Coriobacteriales bacterium]|jgi:hypothetical protein|nr:hypothetical protein [Coriobacteriales bacterium]